MRPRRRRSGGRGSSPWGSSPIPGRRRRSDRSKSSRRGADGLAVARKGGGA
jgi:hypothetical protein